MQTHDKETATVLKTEGGQATVLTNKSKSCKECAKARAGICGKSGAGMVLKVRNSAGAMDGDMVEIGLDTGTHVKGYFIVFVLPIMALILSTYSGHVLSALLGYSGLEVIAGLTGLLLSIIYSIRKIYMIDRSTELHITRVLHGPSDYGLGASSEELDYLRGFEN